MTIPEKSTLSRVLFYLEQTVASIKISKLGTALACPLAIN